MSPPEVYKKQNSFIDVRHNMTLADVVPRIRNLRDRLNALSLSDYKKGIVQSACAELLGEEPIEKGVNPFKLYS